MFRNAQLMLIPLLFCCLAHTASSKEIIDPDEAEANPNVSIEGEYLGDAYDEGMIGARVTAQGNGKSRAILYKGGLPGTGWKAGDLWITMEGTAAELKGQVPGSDDELVGKIADGKLALKKQGDNKSIVLTRIERKTPTPGDKPPGETGASPTPRRIETGPERGTFLFIRTRPDGAKVLIDGKQVGLSDDLFPVDPGVRRIIVELEGHDPNGRDVTVRVGRVERVRLLLTKRPSARAGVPATSPPEDPPATSPPERADQPSLDWPLLQGGYVLTPSTVLDLASRQIISYETPGIDLKRVESCLRTGRGDLYYEHDLLGCMRGCTAMVWRHTEFVKATVESVEPELGLTLYRVAPASRLLISTPEKKHFEVTLLGEIQGQMVVKYKRADPAIVPKSQPPEAAPDDTTPWGEPVEGLQCRLRAERVTWHVAELGRSGQVAEDPETRAQLEQFIHDLQQQKMDEASRLGPGEPGLQQPLPSLGRPFELKLDIRSRSKRTWYAMPPAGELNVEWDGEWFHEEFLGEIEPWPIRPGDDHVDCPIYLGRVVAPPNGPAQDGAQIKATLGWHTVRLAVSLSSDGRRISVVSNPVKIQIVDGKGRAENPEAETLWKPTVDTLLCSLPADQDVEDPPADTEEDGDPKPPKLRYGDRAPSFTGTTLDGSTLKLDDYKGKVVLLDFWATSCGPCIGHMPKIVETYERFHPYGLEIVAVNQDSDRAALEAYLGKNPKIRWPQVFDDKTFNDPVAKQYGVRTIPFHVLVDAKGRIRGMKLHDTRDLRWRIAWAIADRIKSEHRQRNPKKSQSSGTTASRPDPTSPPARKVSFRRDESLGELHVRDWGWTDLNDPDDLRKQGWRRLGEARAEVAIPAAKEVLLVVRKDRPADLAPLSELGTDDLQRITVPPGVTLEDAQLAHIKSLTGLRELDLRGTSVGDAGLAHLRDLKSLRKLLLSDTKVTDEGLARLKTLASLEKLNLLGTNVSDEGMKHLTKLPRLRWPNLYGTKVTDEGLALLAQCPRLDRLQVSGEQITDAGLKHLEKYPCLRSIGLTSPNVTDDGLKTLSKLSAIQSIELWDVRITDKGLEHLRDLKSLNTVTVSNRNWNVVTPEMHIRLQLAHPDCHISL
jgi:peroxiredoxin